MARSLLILTAFILAGCSGRTNLEAVPGETAPEHVTPTPPVAAAGPVADKDVAEYIPTLLAGQLGVDRSSIEMNRPIGGPPLDADELDLVEMIMELEERFDVAISDEELEKAAGGRGLDLPRRITPAQLATLVTEARRRAGAKAD